jgi:hypothetical protein
VTGINSQAKIKRKKYESTNNLACSIIPSLAVKAAMNQTDSVEDIAALVALVMGRNYLNGRLKVVGYRSKYSLLGNWRHI